MNRSPLAIGAFFVRVVLVLVTLLFLASMGGGMAFAAPALVPLHWLAARSATWGRLGWALLAFLSTAEATAIYSYFVIGHFSWSVGLICGAVVSVPMYIVASRRVSPS